MPSSQRRKRLPIEKSARYRIVVQGDVEQTLLHWLAGAEITTSHDEDNGPITTIVGQVRDQAELNGWLNSLYAMHLPVISVDLVDNEKESE